MTIKGKKIDPEPFKPCVSMSEVLHFDPDKPETFTCSPLMNAVLKAFAVVGISSPRAVCEYLQIPAKKLWPAVEVITGYSQSLLRQNIALSRIIALRRQHPDWSSDMYAKALGYSSRAALYRQLGSEEFNLIISNKGKKERYYKNRQHTE